MKVKIKKLSENAVIPSYQKPGDAGLDLIATSMVGTYMYTEYGTSLAFEIPSGHVGLVFPRSSISTYDVNLCNSVGVIDENYRGEVKLRFDVIKRTSEWDLDRLYKVGDRIGQLIIIPIPKIELELVEELSDTIRGDKGFGSSNS